MATDMRNMSEASDQEPHDCSLLQLIIGPSDMSHMPCTQYRWPLGLTCYACVHSRSLSAAVHVHMAQITRVNKLALLPTALPLDALTPRLTSLCVVDTRQLANVLGVHGYHAPMSRINIRYWVSPSRAHQSLSLAAASTANICHHECQKPVRLAHTWRLQRQIRTIFQSCTR